MSVHCRNWPLGCYKSLSRGEGVRLGRLSRRLVGRKERGRLRCPEDDIVRARVTLALSSTPTLQPVVERLVEDILLCKDHGCTAGLV